MEIIQQISSLSGWNWLLFWGAIACLPIEVYFIIRAENKYLSGLKERTRK